MLKMSIMVGKAKRNIDFIFVSLKSLVQSDSYKYIKDIDCPWSIVKDYLKRLCKFRMTYYCRMDTYFVVAHVWLSIIMTKNNKVATQHHRFITTQYLSHVTYVKSWRKSSTFFLIIKAVSGFHT